MVKKKIGSGTLLFAMLLVCMVLVPAVSAQENSKTSDKPSQLEQGLIDALNSNTKLSTDNMIANYCKANKDKISKNSFSSNNPSRYQLKDGSNITFTKDGYIVIDSSKEEANKYTTQPNNKNNRMNPQWVVPPAYTNTITYSVTWYNYLGWKLFTVYTKGYFGYDYNTVEAYHTDSWYTKYIVFNPWEVANWQEGAQPTSSTTAEVYCKGRFSWGYTVAGNYIKVQDKYIKLYISCNKYGQVTKGYIDS